MRFLFFIFSLATFINSFSQSGNQLYYHFRHLDQSDGLLGNKVSSVTQDNRGLFWVSTYYDGLQRFDGVRFLDYSDQFVNEKYRGIIITNLRFSRDRLRVRTSKGRFFLDVLRDKFVKDNSADSGFYRESFHDSENNLWEIGSDYLYRYKKRSDILDGKYVIRRGLRGKSSNLVYDSVNCQYWFADLRTLFVLDVKSKKVFSSKSDDDPFFNYIKKQKSVVFSGLLLDNERNLWINTWGNFFFRYNLNSKKINRYLLTELVHKTKMFKWFNPSNVSLFFLDDHDQIWAGTYGSGLLRYNRKQDVFDYILADREDMDAIRYNFEIIDLFQDRESNIWVGTDRGISIFNPYREYFKIISHDRAGPHSLPPQETEAVMQSRNKDIWVGTWGGGITVFDSLLNFKTQYNFSDQFGNMVWGIVEDNDGKIWVAGQYGIIHRFNPKAGIFDSTFFIGKERVTPKRILKDSDGNIYFGLHNGKITRWNAVKKRFVEYNYGKPVKVNTGSIMNLFFDEKGNIWSSDTYGIYKLDTSRMVYVDSFFTNTRDAFNTTGLASSPFNAKSILLSCSGGGGGFFKGQTKEFKRWEPPKVFDTKKISSLKEDHSGNIWFTSGFDLYNFRPGDKNELNSYSFQKGLISSAFRPVPILELHDGRWCAITNTEVVVFDPEKLLESRRENGRVSITGLKVFDKRIPVDSFLFNRIPVRLGYKQNFITIEFAPSNYPLFTGLKYSYKLSGIDKNWIPAGNQMAAGYANLKPGDYLFSVRSDGSEGNYYTTSIPISINTPFWQRWWFYSIIVLSVISAVYVIIQKRISAIRSRAGFRQKILETEMAALRAQMNPHFIFNCLNAIDSLIQSGERDEATTCLARFARLIRNTLDSSRNNVIAFHKDFETLRLFIEMEQFRSSDKFEFELYANPELLNGDYKVPPMLLQPFIENAIHHGLHNKMNGEKYLRVEARLGQDCIDYCVTDNGVGRVRAEEIRKINRPEHVSYGIGISKERIMSFNNLKQKRNGAAADESLVITDLYDNSGKAAGTRVCVCLYINTNN